MTREETVTTKTDFTEAEWDQVLSGPPMAGMIVAMADHGGMMRETFAMAKVYGEARKQHANIELRDAIAAAKPERDHTKFHPYDDLKRHGVHLLQDAVATLERHASP